MTRKTSNCAICDNSNQASICSICVNYRLNEYNTSLKLLKGRRDSLYSKLSDVLVRKGKGDDQANWRVLQNEKLARLKEKLRHSNEQVTQGRAKIESVSADLKLKYGLLESALSTLEKNRVEQLEKFYPNLICTQSLGHVAITSERLHKQSVVIKQICKLFPQRRVAIEGEIRDGRRGQYDQICNARLPRALDPHSVPSEELSASLGYMVQLLNLVVHNLAAPALHNSGFAGSCSRIWQRDSYWDARPSSRSNEYPLFIPRQNYCSTAGENSWSTDKSSSNFGVASMESEKRNRPDSSGNSNSSYSLASSHSVQTHRDLQKGISLLKKSVACITAYCYNYLCLDAPSDGSTFESFAKLLAILSSSKEVRSVFSLKMAQSRFLNWEPNQELSFSPKRHKKRMKLNIIHRKNVCTVWIQRLNRLHRTCKQVQQLNKSVWSMNSAISSTTLLESAHSVPSTRIENYLPSSTASFLYATDLSDGKNECLIEGWDIVEHPTFPPPPSESEDVEHWTRAMFVDAKRK